MSEMPKPLFPDDPVVDSNTRSPPKRLSRHERRSRASDTPSCTPEDSPFGAESHDLTSPMRSFCASNGLSDVALRGILPSSSSLANPEMDILGSISASIEPSAHPYAQATKTFYESYVPDVHSGSLPAPIPLEAPSLEVPEGKLVPGPSPTIAKKKLRNVKSKRGSEPSSDKPAKGLRDFSYLVMAKVEQKGTTTYNEVSEELVEEIRASGGKGSSNIKRRVYDALNVLRAINIISKQRKSISWVGLPQHSAQALESLKQKKKAVMERIEQKRDNYQEMSKQFSAYQMIAQRNKHYGLVPEDKKIAIPFILASSPSGSQIDCEMAENRSEYCISFQNPFKLYTEVQLLEMMNMMPIPDYSVAQTPSHISPRSISDPNQRD